jgi:hypothetical protein
MSRIHRGRTVEKIIKDQGYLVSKLAKKLNISRNTLYNRFADPQLDYALIMQIGQMIYYDFSVEFPEIWQETNLMTENPLLTLQKEEISTIGQINKKYIRLLEAYSKLLSLLVKIANNNDRPALRKELELIENKLG